MADSLSIAMTMYSLLHTTIVGRSTQGNGAARSSASECFWSSWPSIHRRQDNITQSDLLHKDYSSQCCTPHREDEKWAQRESLKRLYCGFVVPSRQLIFHVLYSHISEEQVEGQQPFVQDSKALIQSSS